MGAQLSKAKLAIFAGGLCGLLFSISTMPGDARAATIGSSRNCDSNAVIRCGALSVDELQQRTSQSGTMTIFNYFGVSSTAVNQMGSNAVVGLVYRDGTVKVGGKTVATNALTAGRLNMAGSQAVTRNGTTFYVRPPSVSFTSSPLSAFVVMRHNQFVFGVLTSCGNPVMATPVKPVKKIAVVKRVKPITPVVQTQTQTQTVVVNQPAPQVEAAQTPPAQIPNTGAGAVIGIGGLAAMVGTVGHSIYQRRRL